jgi:LacI family transcriptional regulator
LSKRFLVSARDGRRGATIVDIAAAANVSISTVSRALAGAPSVHGDLVTRVRAAAMQLGYVPDRRASALVQRRSNSIGAVVPTIDNAIFARAIQALQNRLDADGYRLLLAASEYDLKRELADVQALVEHGVDGIVLVGAEHHPGVAALLDARRVPFVHTWTYEASGGIATIGFDNRDAMRRLVEHLLTLGHRRIAMIAGITAGNDRAAARIAGLKDALAARGLQPEAIVERAYTVPEGRAAARMLLARKPMPTALVCGNDVLAFGALAEARAMDIDVPRVLSVTGFDDLDLASHVVPPLTTMRVPSAAMGRLAAEHLLARIAGNDTSNAVALDSDLILRGSTAPCPAPRPRLDKRAR